ncbi:MAG TPA: glycosyltransferase [Paucimonas sp.]|nr:glycosyltransferase [Paucimonas sp.]
MHIVDITMFYAAEAGGVRTYLTAKTEWLKRQARFRHTVVGPAYGKRQADPLSFIGLPSAPIPCGNGFRLPYSMRAATRVLRALKPDLIEAGDPYTCAWAALRAREELNVPVVAYYHSDLPRIAEHRFGAGARRLAEKYVASLYGRFDLVFAPSRPIAERLRALGIEQVRHQPLGVDTAIFSPVRRDSGLRARLGLPPEARLLVYAGRFTREKKLRVLMQAIRLLGDPYHLLLVGNGDALPMPAWRVIRLPFQRDPRVLAAVIASCDALVHPGDQETFGLIVLEAMACGVPVVGVAAGGVAELIDDDTGVLVAPGDAEALAAGIDALYRGDLRGRRDLRHRGENGRRKALARYDWSLIIPQLVAQYADLLAARQRAVPQVGLPYAAE